jgi:uncharacterized protein YndB with AHSA1/START domain
MAAANHEKSGFCTRGRANKEFMSMNAEQQINARVRRRFRASRERVFDAWLDAKTAGKWLFATATGRSECVEIDARPGGWFYIVERRDSENVDHIGEYLALVRPHRLVSAPRDARAAS